MASPVIKIRRSAVSGNAPTTAQLELGELALNTYDGKLFTEINTGSASIVEIGSNLNTLQVNTITSNVSFTADATFTGDDYNIFWDKSQNQLEFGDNAKAVFGTGSDLSIWHNGTNTHLRNTTGAFQIDNSGGGDLILQAKQGENSIYCVPDAQVQLYYNNALKLATTNTGISVTGNSVVSGNVTAVDGTFTGDINVPTAKSVTAGSIVLTNTSTAFTTVDNATGYFGTGLDLRISHNGTNSVINNTTGSLLFQNGGTSSAWINSSGVIYTNNDVLLQGANYNSLWDKSADSLVFNDNAKAVFGTGSDLSIYHSTHNYLKSTNGRIYLQGVGRLQLQTGDGSSWKNNIVGYQDDRTDIYHNNVIRLTTTAGGANVTGGLRATGIVTATHGFNGNINSTGISTISGFTFPSTDGSEDQSLVTDGSGGLSFKTISGGGGATGAGTSLSSGITTATQGQTSFTAPNVFDDGEQATAFSTQVFVNGVKQRLGASNDYQLSAPQTVTLNSGANVGDDVTIVVYFGHTLEEEFFTATQGQTTFSLAGSLSASKNYKVFLNGVRLRNTVDYNATSAVVLNQAAREGEQIDICSDQAEDRLTANEGQTSFAPSDSNTTSTNMQVYMNGILLRKTEDWTIGSPAVTIINQALTVGDEVDVVVRRS